MARWVNDSAGFDIFIVMEEGRDKDLAERVKRRTWVNIALALLVALAAILGIVRWANISRSDTPEQMTPQAANIPVTISGAVEFPGGYKLPKGDTLHDLIAMAGGFADGADPDKVDLSLPVVNLAGKIDIPYRADYKKPDKPAEPSDVEFPLDINIADALALQALPGIGPVLAKRIVAYREANGPFGKISDLMNVEGIGEDKYGELLGLISTGNEVPWER